jgi:hypothetical protein
MKTRPTRHCGTYSFGIGLLWLWAFAEDLQVRSWWVTDTLESQRNELLQIGNTYIQGGEVRMGALGMLQCGPLTSATSRSMLLLASSCLHTHTHKRKNTQT